MDFDIDRLHNDLRFGFLSLDDLYSWFGEWVNELGEFEIVVYEIPDEHVMIGKSGLQVAFDVDYAELVETMGIEYA